MHWVDWLIVITPLLIVAYIGFRTQRYVKGVADFLAAGRVAGRYVVAVASGEAAMGLISVVAVYEMYYKSGFALGFWNSIAAPIGIIFLLTGFAIYRFRETRAMTLAQFFEIRYSKRFRVFAGILQALSGIINYGLFPAVGARFLMYYCQLPVHVEILGLHFPTYGLIMAGFLSVAVLIVTLGGQITVMTTDCVQGILSYPMYVAVTVVILLSFSWWGEMAPTLLDRPPGKSMLDPFDTYRLQDFNLFYVFVGVLGGIFNILSWSGTQGYNAAAATPHEQKMGRILGTWRGGFSTTMFVLLAVAGYTYLNNANFADRAAVTKRKLDWKVLNDVAPAAGNEQTPITDQAIEQRKKSLSDKEKQVFDTIHHQMLVPVALRDILPVGITGVFCALMIFLMISTDTTYLHSWGSILVQDIFLPLRKTPFTPREQLFFLRLAITLVAVYAFFFSFYYGQVTYILMFFALTGSIWLGGAGAVILGGLYWKRGTTSGAWAGLLTGSTLAILGFIGMNYWADWIYPALARSPALLRWVTSVVEGISRPFEPIIEWRVTPQKFPINGQEVYFITMVSSILVYFLVSLLTCREPFNMERMLHRGKYRREGDTKAVAAKPPRTPRELLRAMLGIDEQFTRGDKILSWSVFIYSMGWGFGTWLVIVIWNLISRWPKNWWASWFFIQYFIVGIAIGVVSTVWFMIGGTLDLRRMFRRLASHEANVLDDGRVVGHVNADDVALVEQVEHTRITEAHEAEKALVEALKEEQRGDETPD